MDDLCAQLRAQREASGLSMNDLFERTRINPTFLEALESGNFDILPEAYARLFLKKYAQEIGLSPREVLARYEALRQSPAGAGLPPRSPARSPSLGLMLAVCFVLVLAAVGIGTLALKDRKGPGSNQTTPGENAQTEVQPSSPSSSEVIAGETDAPSQPAEQPPITPAEKQELSQTSLPAAEDASPSGERVVAAYSLSIGFPFSSRDSVLALSGRALRTTRVVVLADCEPAFDGDLATGRTLVWNAHNRFRVEVEQAPGVALSLQGHALKPLGKPGQKLRLFISRSSIWVEEIAPPSAPPPVDF